MSALAQLPLHIPCLGGPLCGAEVRALYLPVPGEALHLPVALEGDTWAIATDGNPAGLAAYIFVNERGKLILKFGSLDHSFNPKKS